jgi:hypothetical protein
MPIPKCKDDDPSQDIVEETPLPIEQQELIDIVLKERIKTEWAQIPEEVMSEAIGTVLVERAFKSKFLSAFGKVTITTSGNLPETKHPYLGPPIIEGTISITGNVTGGSNEIPDGIAIGDEH